MAASSNTGASAASAAAESTISSSRLAICAPISGMRGASVITGSPAISPLVARARRVSNRLER